MSDVVAPGDVWLVGVGPGDPELLTLKAVHLIQDASVVFHDALVGPAILDLIPPHVRCVLVGKRAGRHSQSPRPRSTPCSSAPRWRASEWCGSRAATPRSLDVRRKK